MYLLYLKKNVHIIMILYTNAIIVDKNIEIVRSDVVIGVRIQTPTHVCMNYQYLPKKKVMAILNLYIFN